MLLTGGALALAALLALGTAQQVGTGRSGSGDIGSYAMVTAAATTSVKAAGGILHRIVVGTPAAGTVSVYDVASASCTGTPGSGKLAVVTLTASTPPETLDFSLRTASGICVVTSVAMNITVVFE